MTDYDIIVYKGDDYELESCVKDINEIIAKIEGRLEEIHK